jgi:hypothetical protein
VAENGGTVIKEITLISVDIQEHWERVNFDIIRISTYDAVLKLPWLAQHNPTINYKNKIIIFNGCDYKLTKNTDIKEVSVRAMNAYFRQDLEQVYLAIVIMKGEDLSFTVL